MDWRESVDSYAPHSVFRWCSYPKTGGRLGNCCLLWGDELKHDYFPFVAIVGPSWKLSLVVYAFPIAILCVMLWSMHLYDSWKLWGILVGVFFFLLCEISALLTTLSNPGIVFRGMLPSTPEYKNRCSTRSVPLFMLRYVRLRSHRSWFLSLL